MYQQLSFIEQEVSSLNKPIDYEIKSLLQTNKKLYLKFKQKSEGNCLYDKESPQYISLKKQVAKEITQNFLEVYHFCSTDEDFIQEYPTLLKSILQFINQFLLDFPLLEIEKEYIFLAYTTFYFNCFFIF